MNECDHRVTDAYVEILGLKLIAPFLMQIIDDFLE